MRFLSVGTVLCLTGACGMGGFDPGNSGSDPGNDMSPIVPRGSGPRAHTLYANFDGALVSPALRGDARHNLSDIISNPATIAPFDPARFGGDPTASREGIVSILEQLFAAVDMQVVTPRPPDDEPYVMVMLGGS